MLVILKKIVPLFSKTEEGIKLKELHSFTDHETWLVCVFLLEKH